MSAVCRKPAVLPLLFSLFIVMGAGSRPYRASAEEPVRVALILALTGIASEDNRPAVRAARLAVDEINRAGGVLGRPLELQIIDNLSTPLGSKNAADQAVQSKVAGVIGPLWSSHALSAAAVLQEARIPMITPTATKPEITRIGDCVFRACMSDAFQGRVMARFAFERLGAHTAVILKNINEAYSITLADMFRESFEEAGGIVTWEGAYTGKAVNFEGVLRQVRDVRADVLYIPGYARDSGLLVQQAAKMGIRATFLGGDGWGEKMRKYGRDAVLGAYYTTHYHPDLPFENNRILKRLYRERFGVERITDIRIPLTYDAVLLFADAVRRAGSTERELVLKALRRTRGFQGATGTIEFGDTGDPKSKEASILRFEERQSILILSVAP
ncbi:MAG: ABC transporter substrate-binding protein [Deltaproteobacteria bacterium]|nr:ABC transporter substrate-binding protein [Deltaproteobacteria bacterium]